MLDRALTDTQRRSNTFATSSQQYEIHDFVLSRSEARHKPCRLFYPGQQFA